MKPRIEGIYSYVFDFTEVNKEEYEVYTVGTYYNHLRFYDDGMVIGICSEEPCPLLDRNFPASFSISGQFEMTSDSYLKLNITGRNRNHDGPLPRNQNIVLGVDNYVPGFDSSSRAFDPYEPTEVALINDKVIAIGKKQFEFGQGQGNTPPLFSPPICQGIYYAPLTYQDSGAYVHPWQSSVKDWASHIEWLRFYDDGSVVSCVTWAILDMSMLPNRSNTSSYSRYGNWTHHNDKVSITLKKGDDVDHPLQFDHPSQDESARKRGLIETFTWPQKKLLRGDQTYPILLAPDGKALYRNLGESEELTYSHTSILEKDDLLYLAEFMVDKNHRLNPIEDVVTQFLQEVLSDKF